MNNETVLDNHPSFGTKHIFFFEGDHLYIYKEKVRINDHVRKISLQNIADLRYLKSNREKTAISLVLGGILAVLTGGALFGYQKSEGNRIEIDYYVDGDEANGSYKTTLKEGDLDEMKDLIRESTNIEV
jgi:hypothetical protein